MPSFLPIQRSNQCSCSCRLVWFWFLWLAQTLPDAAPGVRALDLDDDHLIRRRINPGLGMGRMLGTSKMLSDDDDDDPDFILSTNVRASSSVGGLSGTPGMVGGASLLSTGPGTVSASLGGTYDFLGTKGGLGLPPVYGVISEGFQTSSHWTKANLRVAEKETPVLWFREAAHPTKVQALQQTAQKLLVEGASPTPIPQKIYEMEKKIPVLWIALSVQAGHLPFYSLPPDKCLIYASI
ncbi:hypothetical protein ElyMa_002468600 [Elysia marginata]|uniref:Uncharacterized protein n=1 Tax=Elysia marginata TaxID=1093978 RepID=A0AAV4GQ02_9GAST|nr:hypothetical protein ElyMa_002468600 [Elysia marginata]